MWYMRCDKHEDVSNKPIRVIYMWYTYRCVKQAIVENANMVVSFGNVCSSLCLFQLTLLVTGFVDHATLRWKTSPVRSEKCISCITRISGDHSEIQALRSWTRKASQRHYWKQQTVVGKNWFNDVINGIISWSETNFVEWMYLTSMSKLSYYSVINTHKSMLVNTLPFNSIHWVKKLFFMCCKVIHNNLMNFFEHINILTDHMGSDKNYHVSPNW